MRQGKSSGPDSYSWYPQPVRMLSSPCQYRLHGRGSSLSYHARESEWRIGSHYRWRREKLHTVTGKIFCVGLIIARLRLPPVLAKI